MNKVILTSLTILVGTSVFAANGTSASKAPNQLTHFSDGSRVSCTAYHVASVVEKPESLLLNMAYTKRGGVIIANGYLKTDVGFFGAACTAGDCSLTLRRITEKSASVVRASYAKSDNAIVLESQAHDNTSLTLVCTKVRRGSF